MNIFNSFIKVTPPPPNNLTAASGGASTLPRPHARVSRLESAGQPNPKDARPGVGARLFAFPALAFALLTLVAFEARAQADTTPPTLVSVEATTEIPVNEIHDGDLAFKLTFDEEVTGVECVDFELNGQFINNSGSLVSIDLAGTGLSVMCSDGDIRNAEGAGNYSTVWFVTFTNNRSTANSGIFIAVNIEIAFDTGSSTLVQDRAGNEVDNTSPSGANNQKYAAVRFRSGPATANTSPPYGVFPQTATQTTNPFTVELLFDEPLMGFEPMTDLTITNGELVSSTAEPGNFLWTLIIRVQRNDMNELPDTVTVAVPVGMATDVGGTASTLEITRTFAINLAEGGGEVRGTIADFLQRRGAQIMAARPDFIRLLDGSGIGASSLSLNDGSNRRFAFSASGREMAGLWGGAQSLSLEEGDRAAARGDFWVSLRGIRTESGGNEDDFYWLSVGAHRRLDANRILGGFIAIDQMDSDIRIAGAAGEGTLEGTGWLAGPYLVGRVAERGLYYEVHAAWGQSTNDFSPDGTFEDEFDTERYLLGGTLKGEYPLKGGMAGWTLRPAASLAWFEEQQDSYTSEMGQEIAEQRISLGEFRVGPELGRVVRLESGGDLSVDVGLYGVASLEVDAGDSKPETFDDGDTRGRVKVDLGYARTAAAAADVGAGLYYDGIGQSDYEAFGIDFRVRVTF